MERIVAVNIAAWLACAFFLVAFWNSIRKAIDREKGGEDKDKKTIVSPQPLEVQITEALHQQLASKTDVKVFEKQKDHCTGRHGQLFKGIDDAKKEARKHTDDEILKVQKERAAQLEKLNNEFTFIRESIAAINTELRIRNETNDRARK